ncbi:MAG TPA: serine/threonine protein kinase [Gammaproteobacteria bacterium]|jgi:Ser/Thr protein kinase RdoA (MazF antagonist)|nr:serine/threonine protein kinase [Gammaproteobacteria bacterium]
MTNTPQPAAPYADLTPDTLLDAVEAAGWRTNGELLALNSYENRVYQVGLDEGQPLVAKFYRPGRWTDAAILEEHGFVAELAAREIPVVAPLTDAHGATLLHHAGFRFALFPRRGGRAPELDSAVNLEWLGRFLGRIHAVGMVKSFRERTSIDVDSLGVPARTAVLACGFLPDDLVARYREVADAVLDGARRAFARAGNYRRLRLHGDCHPGNILWTDAGPHFVDFDDAADGPAIQDLWMLLSGSRADMTTQLDSVLEGYRQFADFDAAELHLLEALRALRIMHYAAWIARRWDDPAFPRSFPWFNTPRYWENHIQNLREQIPLIDEPPLEAA